MKFLMPSKGRSDVIDKAINFVGPENLVVLVDEIEKTEYKKVVPPGAKLETHPSLYGLGPILKYGLEMLLEEDYVIILGDDCYAFCYKFHPKIVRSYDTEHFRYVVDNTHQMALDLGTPLFPHR